MITSLYIGLAIIIGAAVWIGGLVFFVKSEDNPYRRRK